jgi:uncharacterized protein DUF6475
MAPEGMLTWIEALDDLSDQDYCTALKRFSRESKEFPSPAAIRQYAGAVGLPDKDRTTIAWNLTRKAISEVGGYRTVVFDDPLITATIRMIGGWVRLCDMTSAELDKERWEFEKTYAAVSKSAIGDASPLPGICERTNSKLGHSSQHAPKRIETGLAVHPVAAAFPCVERDVAPRIEGPKCDSQKELAGVFVDRMRTAMGEKLKPVEVTPDDAEAHLERLRGEKRRQILALMEIIDREERERIDRVRARWARRHPKQAAKAVPEKAAS